MASHRTTVSLEPEVYDAARGSYRQPGFNRLGDLINAALQDYLHRHQVREKVRRMEEAASDPHYLELVRQIGEEVAFMDVDGLRGDY